MRNPQGHYSFDYYFYKLLQSVASTYGLSASDYASKVLLPAVKEDAARLGIPLSNIFNQSELADFVQREGNLAYVRNAFYLSPTMIETENTFNDFKNYILQGKASSVQAPTPVQPVQVSAAAPAPVPVVTAPQVSPTVMPAPAPVPVTTPVTQESANVNNFVQEETITSPTEQKTKKKKFGAF